MSRRQKIRGDALKSTAALADVANEALQDIYERLERLERRQFITVRMTANAAGIIPPIVFAAPPWPVQAVYVAKLFDSTNNLVASLGESLLWEVTSRGISIPAMYVVTVSATYDITFEVRG